jgi:hypothetical protein
MYIASFSIFGHMHEYRKNHRYNFYLKNEQGLIACNVKGWDNMQSQHTQSRVGYFVLTGSHTIIAENSMSLNSVV